ncbi:subtilisin-like protein [Lactarius pseudohatsudake]|nr:subtilisin-like protein [Lactarius pseudohatsudake]
MIYVSSTPGITSCPAGRPPVTSRWHRHYLHVALKPHDENALIDALYEVSTPRSPKHVISNNPPRTMYSPVRLFRCRYRAHLSKEDVAKLVAPHPDTLELVHSWLAHHGMQSSFISTTHGGGWLTTTEVPVSQADELGASYQLYRPTGTNDTAILCMIGYAHPVALHTHVQTVVPTTYFASTGTLWQTPQKRSRRRNCGYGTEARGYAGGPALAECWLYAYMPAATDRNMIRIVGFGGDYPSTADLTTFILRLNVARTRMTRPFKVERINGGGYNPNNPDEEPNQSILYAQAIAYPTPLTFSSVGGNSVYNANTKRKSHPPPTWFKDVFDLEDVPQTISISYGDSENNVPLEYASALCNLFAKLGARGGNVGVGGGDCKDSSGSVQFTPNFPASCPYVTSVGGVTGLGRGRGEISGRLLDLFSAPDMPGAERDAVLTFLQHLGSQYDGLYKPRNPQHLYAGVQILYCLEKSLMSGTSCAAPTVAGIVSLLNDFLISNDEEPLGWLNRWLYWLYDDGLQGLYDVTSGSYPGYGTDGFSAIAGWDPVRPADFVSLHFRHWLIFGFLQKTAGLVDTDPE